MRATARSAFCGIRGKSGEISEMDFADRATGWEADGARVAESMLQLRDFGSARLLKAVETETRALIHVIRFLVNRFRIFCYDYIPYEGQLLVLLKFFELADGKDDARHDVLARWFWATSLNEELRGKPDHYVARMLDRLRELVTGDMKSLQQRLTITADDLMERRFIRGKALSGAIAAMLAVRGARSLITGDAIPPEAHMSEFNAENYQGIVSASELALTDGDVTSSKLIANVILLPAAELRQFRSLSARQLLKNLKLAVGKKYEEVLLSQYIPLLAAEALEQGDVKGFLRERAKCMIKGAEELVYGRLAEAVTVKAKKG